MLISLIIVYWFSGRNVSSGYGPSIHLAVSRVWDRQAWTKREEKEEGHCEQSIELAGLVEFQGLSVFPMLQDPPAEGIFLKAFRKWEGEFIYVLRILINSSLRPSGLLKWTC